jgi:hypothetical protein
MTIRCKFVCQSIQDNGTPESKRVTLGTQYDPELPEDQRFTRWTPSGTLDVVIDNPAAVAQLAVGKAFYVDLLPVE